MKYALHIAALGTLASGLAWNFAGPAVQAAGPVAAPVHETAAQAAQVPAEIATPVDPKAAAPTMFTLTAGSAVEPRAVAQLAARVPGQAVTFLLPGGVTLRGEVQAVRREDDGWTRVGGTLADGASFALSTREGEAAGFILLPGQDRAWQLQRQADGSFGFVERRAGDVLCLGLPRRENEFAPAEKDTDVFTVPLFNSRPGATAVLYLDFDGATVIDPFWAGGFPIDAPHARLTAPQITKVCEHVAGDYASFNVNISTDPARYANTAVGHRMRAIVTRNDRAAPGAGGVAYVGSFAHAPADGFTPDIPCWVFEDFAVDSCAEALSHELGHTLGLHHDGRDFPNGRHVEYYAGQGSGATGWAPIMGVAYYRRLSQWSKGEYLYANNHEDDIAIIAGSKNAFGFVADEAGGTTATATKLAASGPIVDQPGVIRNAQDVDVFRFVTNGGKLGVRVRNEGPEGNIDLRLELLNSAGAVLRTNNPVGALGALIQQQLAGGTYFLRVSGTGKGDPLRKGYTNYGCIGAYRVTGKINGLAP